MPHFLKSLFSPLFLCDLEVLRECYHIEKFIESCMSVCMCTRVHILRCNVFVLMHNTYIYAIYMCVCAQYIICAHTCIPRCIHMHPYVCLLHFLNPNNSSFLPHRKSHVYEKLKNKYYNQRGIANNFLCLDQAIKCFFIFK